MADRGQICFSRGSAAVCRASSFMCATYLFRFLLFTKLCCKNLTKLTLLQENTRKKQGVHDEPGEPKRPLFLFLAKDTIFITCLYIY
jgi:hypothetical protein